MMYFMHLLDALIKIAQLHSAQTTQRSLNRANFVFERTATRPPY